MENSLSAKDVRPVDDVVLKSEQAQLDRVPALDPDKMAEILTCAAKNQTLVNTVQKLDGTLMNRQKAGLLSNKDVNDFKKTLTADLIEVCPDVLEAYGKAAMTKNVERYGKTYAETNQSNGRNKMQALQADKQQSAGPIESAVADALFWERNAIFVNDYDNDHLGDYTGKKLNNIVESVGFQKLIAKDTCDFDKISTKPVMSADLSIADIGTASLNKEFGIGGGLVEEKLQQDINEKRLQYLADLKDLSGNGQLPANRAHDLITRSLDYFNFNRDANTHHRHGWSKDSDKADAKHGADKCLWDRIEIDQPAQKHAKELLQLDADELHDQLRARLFVYTHRILWEQPNGEVLKRAIQLSPDGR